MWFPFITDKKIEKAKSNLSLTLDISSQAEKIGNLKSIGKTLGKSLKFLGKAADIVGKAITTIDVVNEAFVSKEWEFNQLVDILFGDELISTTKEGLLEKYIVAMSIMKEYVKNGIVDYTSDGVNIITSYAYKEDYIDSAKKVINNVDKKNNYYAWK